MSEENKSKEENGEMTPDQRLAWLRDRGVLVETPEERKAKAITEIMKEPDGEDAAEETIAYVMVPHDTSKPLQEFTFQPNRIAVDGDKLVQHLKPLFGGDDANVDFSLLKEQAAANPLLASATDGDGAAPTVSDEALQQVAKQGSVETFTLVHSTPSNEFTSIQIYLDEVGLLKKLPLNPRASEYAKRAGFEPPPQFYGNVLLGRVRTYPKVEHMNFVMGKDTALDAEWLKRATTENLEYQMQLNQITGRNDVQPGVSGADGVAKKEEGYTWTQTEEELELIVRLPVDATSKDVKCKYHPQSLQVSCRSEVLVSLDLFERIDPEGCTWTLERDSKFAELIVTMEKIEVALWPRIRD